MVIPGWGPQLKTDPQFLLTLLQIQDADLALHRILARRDALPEAKRARELAAAAVAARDQAVLRRTEASDLQREVAKLEEEIDKVRTRAKRDGELLASGKDVSARQLTELQHEIGSLERRQADLEDVELELLEQAETAEAALREAERQRDEASGAAEAAKLEAEDAMRALAEEHRATTARRAELSGGVPADLLALYEKIRKDHGGIGAAEFVGDQCGACRLQMIPSELAEVKAAPPDEVLRCEECRRILVRTAMLRQ